MDKTVVLEIIREYSDTFLDSVYHSFILNPLDISLRRTGAFSLFTPDNNDFYSYKEIESILESRIRDMLVTPILLELLTRSGYTVLVPEQKGNKLYAPCTNDFFEENIPFEFVLFTKEKHIGIRYTSFIGSRSISHFRLRFKYGVDQIIIIRWNDKCRASANKRPTCVNDFLPSEFFNLYLTAEIYDVFLKELSETIKQALQIIGYDTIPTLSLHYLSDFKLDLDDQLSNEVYRDKHFLIEATAKQSSYKLSNDDYSILDSRFLKSKLYRSMLGKQSFAKCFITSEYLFNIFKHGGSFDYTSIIVGYIKSVEQLLYCIITGYLKEADQMDLWISTTFQGNIGKFPNDYKEIDITQLQLDGETRKVSKQRRVRFIHKNERYFNTMFQSLTRFLEENTSFWRISPSGIEYVIVSLLQYANSCRNEHFHTHNINSWQEVEGIRNNTILLFYYLVGGLKVASSDEAERTALGIADNNFDRLYRALRQIPKSVRKFVIELDNGISINAIRPIEQSSPVFVDGGSLEESEILFVRVKDFTQDHYGYSIKDFEPEKRFVIKPDFLPSKVWYYSQGMKHLAWSRGDSSTI